MENGSLVAVVLCGGTGTRLWPLSRAAYPKQFVPLLDENSLFQKTLLRIPNGFGPTMVVLSDEHRFIAMEQIRECAISPGTLLVEPCGRNTAPSAAVAALHALDSDADAILVIMPADHVIEDTDALQRAWQLGRGPASSGKIVLFGIKPKYAATSYGYIRKGKEYETECFEATAFVEKPDLSKAETFVAAGEYFWNSGIFMITARQLLAELERHVPAVVAAARSALSNGEQDLNFLRLDGPAYSRAPAISLDHAVMENTENAVVIPLECGWADLGTWNALWGISKHDEDGNVVVGDVFADDSHNCLLRTDGPLIAAIGVNDLVVVATEDVVLILRKDRDQDVKHMVDRLKRQQRMAAISSRRMYRPWGFYESIQRGHRYQVKRIRVKPGARLSLQKHFHRAEHWVVVNGTALVTRDEQVLLVRENESIYLPLGSVHRLENPGKLDLNLIEVQSGAYLEEDDIVRLDDAYHRQ